MQQAALSAAEAADASAAASTEEGFISEDSESLSQRKSRPRVVPKALGQHLDDESAGEKVDEKSAAQKLSEQLQEQERQRNAAAVLGATQPDQNQDNAALDTARLLDHNKQEQQQQLLPLAQSLLTGNQEPPPVELQQTEAHQALTNLT